MQEGSVLELTLLQSLFIYRIFSIVNFIFLIVEDIPYLLHETIHAVTTRAQMFL
jgi:hypothetical protein